MEAAVGQPDSHTPTDPLPHLSLALRSAAYINLQADKLQLLLLLTAYFQPEISNGMATSSMTETKIWTKAKAGSHQLLSVSVTTFRQLSRVAVETVRQRTSP